MKAGIAALERGIQSVWEILEVEKSTLAMHEAAIPRAREYIAEREAEIAEMRKAIEVLRAMG